MVIINENLKKITLNTESEPTWHKTSQNKHFPRPPAGKEFYQVPHVVPGDISYRVRRFVL